jgi:Fe-S-cluster containining protein
MNNSGRDLRINSEIACDSVVWKQRLEFCANYLRHKQSIFVRLEREVLDQTERDGEIITCHRGCAYCCSVYIEATLKECEAIVYHLYQNEKTLESFLRRYPNWLRRTRQLAKKCTQAIRLVRKTGQSEAAYRTLYDALLFYKLQNTACPFLDECSCSIHSARPFTCAAHFATNAPEWCSPLDPRQPKIYKGSFADEMADLSFYHEHPSHPCLTFMPVKVHEILEKDFNCLYLISGSPDLAHNEINVTEITAVLRTYL